MVSERTTVSVDQKRLQELEEAFALFNETSQQLTAAYTALQQQLAFVQAKLAETEKHRKQAVARLDQLLNLLPAAVIVLDENRRVVEMNPSAEAVLGRDALGCGWEEVQRNVFLSQNAAGELITHDEHVFQIAETPLEKGTGQLILIQDVTAARQLQKLTSRHQRLNSMGEMAASLAHQIRTPLSTATLYVSQLGNPLPEDQAAAFSEKALTSLRHIEHLIEDMLQYAKGGKAKEKPFAVNALLAKLNEAVQPQIQQKIARLKTHPLKEDVTYKGDEEALLTALQNLVTNALEACGPNAKIEIMAEVVNNQLVLRVMDNGPGIDEQVQHKIFEPFFTLRARGTGLGLAVVRAVAEAHGGEVRVHSLKGVGSTFSMHLPLVSLHEDSTS